MTTWVLSCDAGSARILAATAKAGEAWRLLHTIDNPSGRARTSDLVSDHPGRVRQSGTGAQPAMEAVTDPADVQEERHARRLARLLTDAHHEHRFDRLVVVAPPRFLGRLRPLLHPDVERAVVAQVHHDYQRLTLADLQERIRPLLEQPRDPGG